MVDGLRPCILGIKPFAVLTDFAAVVPGGVACLLCRLPTLPLACFAAPIPLPPFPAGRGEIFSFLMQGAKPLA